MLQFYKRSAAFAPPGPRLGVDTTAADRYSMSSIRENLSMTVDDETKGALDSITAAGFPVTIDETPDGTWIVEAIDPKTNEPSSVEADDSFAAAVELAHQLGVPLDNV